MEPLSIPAAFDALAERLARRGHGHGHGHGASRPLVCYGHDAACAQAESVQACEALARAKGWMSRLLHAPLLAGDVAAGLLQVGLVDCSQADAGLADWARWMAQGVGGDGSGAKVAIFTKLGSMSEEGKRAAMEMAFDSGSQAQCVFATESTSLEDLFAALPVALPGPALARVDFSAPAGSEAEMDLRRLAKAMRQANETCSRGSSFGLCERSIALSTSQSQIQIQTKTRSGSGLLAWLGLRR